MKTKLKSPKAVELKFEAYKKEFIRLMKLAPQSCATAEQAVWFFANEKHQFPDGTVHPLVMLCTATMPWEIFAKAAVKENKKFTLLGKAYYQKLPTSNKATLQINVEKGSAKADKINKAAKALLNKANVQLVVAKAAPAKKESEEEEDTTPLAAQEPAEILQKKQKAQATFATFSSLMQKLGIQV
ncbi:hypothetical protein [Aureispira anguillae]|uniref:Uncharacterized protein n=1 Tax=Aureispira anguillae TaxID=2864201 RepID=A0A915YEQ1_9BACT|nr:hypothetical protein [Aureispira anguillae]BDS11765.1 hypothetical protein AsAng_0024790 [Aureispira anguillae]